MGANDKMTPHDYANAKALVVELQKENALLLERTLKLVSEIEAALGAGEAVRVREGGGPENVAASVAATLAMLRRPK